MQIDYESAFNLIATKINEILNSGSYEGYSVCIEQERQFVRRKTFSAKTIYLVVSFGSASFNPWQTYSNVAILGVSEENAFDAVRGILSEFASENNLVTADGCLMTWGLPVISGQFNEIATGFRATFTLQGAMLFNGGSVATIDAVYYLTESGERESIAYLSVQDSYQASLAPQAFPSGEGWALSKPRYGTYVITFSMYLDASTEFGQKVLKAKYDGAQEEFGLIVVINGEEHAISSLWLSQATAAQNIGQLPTMSVSLSR